jgi:hypothetical protein
MSDGERDYQVGPGKPPLHTRFRKGQSGNPRGRSAKDLPVLLADALNEPVYLTTNGRRRKITKREAVIAQLVNKSADADLRATKMLIDMLTDIEKKTGAAPPPPGPAPLTEADEEVMQSFVERVRRQVLAEIAAKNAAEECDPHRVNPS